jgi:hypothetical protein
MMAEARRFPFIQGGKSYSQWTEKTGNFLILEKICWQRLLGCDLDARQNHAGPQAPLRTILQHHAAAMTFSDGLHKS